MKFKELNNQWNELRRHKEVLNEKLDCLIINANKVQNEMRDFCYYCGSKIDKERIKRRIKRIKDELTEIAKFQKIIDTKKYSIRNQLKIIFDF